MWHGQDPLTDWIVRSRVPAEEAHAIHNGCGAGERTRRSQVSAPTAAGVARWARYELIAIDEVGYVPMADIGAEFLFQVIAQRAEKAAVVLTTNLPSRSGRR
jgi:hypothetical protein